MKYSDSIAKDMAWLSKNPDVRFLGQGVINAGRIYHTLDGVPKKKCIEMPIAENLIMGVANGMSLVGYRPVVVFQRMDFMLIAADQIINHTALMKQMSGGQYTCPVIIRACIGSKSLKFDVGPQHRHDFRHIFQRYLPTLDYIPGIYQRTYDNKCPTIIVEERDKYADDV